MLLEVGLLEMAGGICWADVTRCHASGSSSSVCVLMAGFILGAMIAHAPQVCSPIQPEYNQSDSGINNTHSTHTLHTGFGCLYIVNVSSVGI